jgi:diguanylate cyclase (GGDEF)-like protein
MTVFAALGYWAGKRNEKIAHLAESLEITSLTDELTGLFNRRYLLTRLEEELKRAERYGYPAACLFIDLDNFKSINDRYGHAMGDEVLKAVAKAAKSKIRGTDILGRYGGDELLAVLPNAALYKSFYVAERIRREVESISLTAEGSPVRVTVSIGVVSTIPDRMTMAHFLKLADRALMQSKARGKNVSIINDVETLAARP